MNQMLTELRAKMNEPTIEFIKKKAKHKEVFMAWNAEDMMGLELEGLDFLSVNGVRFERVKTNTTR